MRKLIVIVMSIVALVLVLAAGCSKEKTELNIGEKESNKPEAAAILDSAKLTDVFGFADAEGKHLIVTGLESSRLDDVSKLNKAIGENGKVLYLSFMRWQEEGEASNGRQMAHNFDNLAGFIFAIEEGTATGDETYYLFDGNEVSMNAFVPIVKPSSSDVAEEMKSAIVKAKNRAIMNIWHVADMGENAGLYVAQFEKQDKDMLFSIVLKRDDKLVFKDYPAVMEDGTSVWRVDDGGEVIPDMFNFLFAANTGDGLVIGVEWWAPEGAISFLLQENGDIFTESEFGYSRYTSPI
ncbi:hypothetical protein PAECIP111893_03890 [Paenibacillus plantiphilus]|uniref:Uncharacterized protein n=1 Tax=Paenibacillus plantiphilus TaxID=2905650 RepID=A0ABN8GT52_9BACL|nr:hypothetical protein [Paenibacillus plantiphilus]CAH1215191.1 hypothetical protein PAECIP111893_03890 [Paenibacillus plantiphilus]